MKLKEINIETLLQIALCFFRWQQTHFINGYYSGPDSAICVVCVSG